MQFCVIKKESLKTLLQTEEVAQLILGVLGLYYLPIHLSGWLWVILFFSPDISMLGYLINTRIGAYAYNLFHHKLIAILIIIIGFCIHIDTMLLVGILLFAHSCFDRIWGYGLKYTDSFQHTHLGKIGKAAQE